MEKKIYEELVLIRKELQAIRSSKESNQSNHSFKPTTVVKKIGVVVRRVPINQ